MLVIKPSKFIREIVDKYINEKEFTEEELIECYCYEGDRFVACFNEGGNCFIEEYNTIQELLDDIPEEDKQLILKDENIQKQALKIVADRWITKERNQSTELTIITSVLTDEELTTLMVATQLLRGE